MAEDRRSSRNNGNGPRSGRGGPAASGGRSGGGRAGSGRDGGRGGASRSGGPSRGGAPRSGSRGGSGRWEGERSSEGRPFRSGGGSGKDTGKTSGKGPGGKPRGPRQSGEGRFERRTPRPERTQDQRAYDGPDLPDDISGKELDRQVANQLRGLPEKLAARIARHLVAAGMFIDSDPELAYQHAKAAKSRAQRIAVVREALGEAAYAAGHYAEALAELRAAKRMNGATAYLPIMADCHRALGHPEQAIKLAHSPSVVNFPAPAKAEMTIVEAGARRDMGQVDAALRTLEQAPLMHKSREPWVVRLRYAYADALEEAGRLTDAQTWFHRTFAIDSEEITDAEQRAAALDKRLAED